MESKKAFELIREIQGRRAPSVALNLMEATALFPTERNKYLLAFCGKVPTPDEEDLLTSGIRLILTVRNNSLGHVELYSPSHGRLLKDGVITTFAQFREVCFSMEAVLYLIAQQDAEVLTELKTVVGLRALSSIHEKRYNDTKILLPQTLPMAVPIETADLRIRLLVFELISASTTNFTAALNACESLLKWLRPREEDDGRWTDDSAANQIHRQTLFLNEGGPGVLVRATKVLLQLVVGGVAADETHNIFLQVLCHATAAAINDNVTVKGRWLASGGMPASISILEHYPDPRTLIAANKLMRTAMFYSSKSIVEFRTAGGVEATLALLEAPNVGWITSGDEESRGLAARTLGTQLIYNLIFNL